MLAAGDLSLDDQRNDFLEECCHRGGTLAGVAYEASDGQAAFEYLFEILFAVEGSDYAVCDEQARIPTLIELLPLAELMHPHA